MMNSEPFINIADYAWAARETLPKDVRDYFEGRALDELLRGGTDTPENCSSGDWVPDTLSG